MRSVKEMKTMGSYGTIGLEIVLSVLLGLFIGMKLDDWLDTKPWLTILWFGFGCAAGGRAVYRSWKDMQAAAKREELEEGNPAQQFPDDKSSEWKREEEKEKKAREEAGKGRAPREDGAADEPSRGDSP
jgi:ATP synthase protein I